MAGSLFRSVFGSNQSRALTKAYANNVNDQTFSDPLSPQNAEPGTVFAASDFGQAEDGTFEISHEDVSEAPSQIKFKPYADGPAGSWFYARIWGWQLCGTDPASCIWSSELLVELLCRTGDIPGPTPPDPTALSPYIIRETERFCSVIRVTRGSLGLGGQVSAPGGRSSASVTVTVRNCAMGRFQFAQGRNQSHLTMNALWCFL